MITEAEKARLFAKQYVNLVEALKAEGVEDAVARSEARMTALVALQLLDISESQTYDPAKGPCPLCGNG